MESETVTLQISVLESLCAHSGMRGEGLIAQCRVATPHHLARILATKGTIIVPREIAEDLAQAFGVPTEVLVNQEAWVIYRLVKQVTEEEEQPFDRVFYDKMVERRYAARTSSYERTTHFIPYTIQDVREFYRAHRTGGK